MELRHYQREAINSFYDNFNDNDSQLIVVPTGAGKSLIQSHIANDAAVGGARVLCVTHRAKLIKQNYENFHKIFPRSDIITGIYSAELKRKEKNSQILFASIQSIGKKEMPIFDLIIIDEAHLVPLVGSGLYLQFIEKQRLKNNKIKILGLTATPYRLDGGVLINQEKKTNREAGLFDKKSYKYIFDRVIYNVNMIDLISDGFLANLRNKILPNEISTKKISVRRGEFDEKEVENEFLSNIDKICLDVKEKTVDRKKVLIFAATQKLADIIAGKIGCNVYHSGLQGPEKEKNLRDFETGAEKYFVNVNILTTGFDFPAIDAIVLIRATLSVSLYIQMVGRGSRLAPDKVDCLILDYGGNIRRFGAINDPKIKQILLQGAGQKFTRETISVVNVCPLCFAPMSGQECLDCGHIMISDKIQAKPEAEKNIIKRDEPIKSIVDWVDVVEHIPIDGRESSAKIIYYTDRGTFYEWLAFNYYDDNFYKRESVKKMIIKWQRNNMTSWSPTLDLQDFIDHAKDFIKKIDYIIVDASGRFPKILTRKFSDNEIDRPYNIDDEIPF